MTLLRFIRGYQKEGGEIYTMTQFKRQLIAVLTAGSTALSMLAVPAFAATTTSLNITGNGANTDNTIRMETSKDTTVVQSNNAVVTNNVTSNSSTGGNSANDNTTGDVTILTGKATSTTNVQNTLNTNVAKVDCCNTGSTTVTIDKNAAYSDNEVKLEEGRHGDSTEVFQDNKALVTNNVDSHSYTGSNDANRNTGGDVTIGTGDATATSTVKTTANVNVATIGGGTQTGGLSVKVLENGANSDNTVRLELSHDSTIVQDNFASVLNMVDSTAKTGLNDAKDNAGGDVLIVTGKATAASAVDNMVNFNAADIDCGCLLNTEAKIAGNATDSDNTISAELGNDREVFQGGREGDGNFALLYNDATAYAKTGMNDAKYNVGGVQGGDPAIVTGAASSTTTASNTGNVNVYGGNWVKNLPSVSFNFNLSQIAKLLAW